MMDREEIEALGEGAGGLGRQEVEDLLALHDAYAALAATAKELTDHIGASPLGWRDGRPMSLRSTTDADVIEWLQHLEYLRNRMVESEGPLRDIQGDASAGSGSAEFHPDGISSRATSSQSRNDRGRLCYLRREMRDGPWHGEPDLVEFQHAGMSCLAERSRNGTWCGYVELPADHPWRGIIGDLSRGNVHGGICRIRPRRGALDAEFVGFECDHVDLDDLIPSHPSTHASYSEYRDLAFVREDVERMAEMARDAAATTPED